MLGRFGTGGFGAGAQSVKPEERSIGLVSGCCNFFTMIYALVFASWTLAISMKIWGDGMTDHDSCYLWGLALRMLLYSIVEFCLVFISLAAWVLPLVGCILNFCGASMLFEDARIAREEHTEAEPNPTARNCLTWGRALGCLTYAPSFVGFIFAFVGFILYILINMVAWDGCPYSSIAERHWPYVKTWLIFSYCTAFIYCCLPFVLVGCCMCICVCGQGLAAHAREEEQLEEQKKIQMMQAYATDSEGEFVDDDDDSPL